MPACARSWPPDSPAIDIGPHCTNPYECDFKGHCWRHIPEHSIFDLKGRGVDKWELYRQIPFLYSLHRQDTLGMVKLLEKMRELVK
ncbi:MAG: hypothetical protein WBX50_04420 [Candidatus Deferrimicrobiaceae bacterium]